MMLVLPQPGGECYSGYMKLIKFIAALAMSFAAGAVGSLATIPNIPTWYAALEKPFFNPPNWVFGPVWTVLYLLIGISFYLIWTAKTKQSKQTQYILFGIQVFLNGLWSLVFFGWHLPALAFVVIVFLLATIMTMIITYQKISATAAYLLLPYAAWITFASCLNIAIIMLN